MERSDRMTLDVIVLSVVIALGATGWFFLKERSYDFVTEMPCDPTTETCFVYECSPEEECTDGVSYYSVVEIQASEFETCTSEVCADECATGAIECRFQECDVEAGDTCSSFPIQGPETE